MQGSAKTGSRQDHRSGDEDMDEQAAAARRQSEGLVYSLGQHEGGHTASVGSV